MKSIKQQFIDLKEGKMSQQNFMRNLRMTMPQYVTNVTSYGDAVKILRNKGILNESLIKQLESKTGDAPISKMSRKDMIDFLGTTEEKAKNMSDEELRDAVSDKNDDLREDYDMEDYGSDDDEAKEEERIDNMINQRLEDEAEEKAKIDAMIKKYKDEESGKYTTGGEQFPIKEAKSKWENTSGKSMYSQFKEIDTLNGQEVLIGIDFEIEKNHELSKLDAIKLVLKNLKKNPIYYTATLMAGKEMTEIPTIGKFKPGSDQMRPLKGEDSLVDKDNGMKPVKDVAKVKASSNKAKKETNKPEGTISLMSLVAKASRGVQKMNATGEKMKVVKENLESVTSYGDFKIGDKVMVDPEVATEAGLKAGKIYNITGFRIYKRGSMLQNADALLDNGEEINTDYIIKAPKLFTSSTNLGSSLSKLSKDDLMEMIRKELEEALGAFGGDNVTDVAGHQLDENK